MKEFTVILLVSSFWTAISSYDISDISDLATIELQRLPVPKLIEPIDNTESTMAFNNCSAICPTTINPLLEVLGSVKFNTVLIPHESDCTKFYQCYNGRKYEQQCPRAYNQRYYSLYFNPELQRCDWPANVKCDCELKETPPTTIIANTEDIIVTTEDIIANTEDIIANTKDIIATTEDTIANTEDIIARTESIIPKGEDVIATTEST